MGCELRNKHHGTAGGTPHQDFVGALFHCSTGHVPKFVLHYAALPGFLVASRQ